MGLEGFEPIFGETRAECSAPNPSPLRPFLFYVHASGSSALRFHATDFHSRTFEAVRTVEQLEDMREMTGIVGSWSEFMDYVRASIKSDDVKLILEGHPGREGASYAKLIARRSKGMPVISISLAKLEDAAAAHDAMANLSLELFKESKSMHNLSKNVQEQCFHLTKEISAEQEKNEILQRQLDTVLYSKRQKKMNDKSNSHASSVAGLQDSPDKQAAQNLDSTKMAKRVVPAYRRAKVRGAVLQDTDDDEDK
ncbi:uncharacterized protein LOC127803634 isoform X2 [Diospyros lotus]|uniref:uncharacterized protein LOC127803634 isoform X2 n=1 Tax=Diospyros lotus TaxID=55363 RepID=UPI0022511EC4|nr:uncharacterized protein LOC127803634 isoform X2 [Diospyros lotus]